MRIGEPAPDFELPDSGGRSIRLSALRGSPVVLVFYPRDETPGCTRQHCDLRDSWELFQAAGARVLGISPDTVESHAAFKERHGLPHTLLADPDHVAIDRYQVWGTVRFADTERSAVVRSTFLIGADGTLVEQWRDVSPETHAGEVLARLKELAG